MTAADLPPPLLTLDALSCERDDRLLFSQLSLTASAGEIWQVAGANGAGKTTLLRVLVGLHGFYEGEVRWQLPGCHHRQGRDGLLYLGHRPGLRDELTALENLRALCAIHQQDATLLPAALAAVGLRGFEDAPVGSLSAGQKRRVALARLWLPGKPVWVLDEPFTAIDLDGVALLEQQLRVHAAAGGLVIYTSHHRLAGDIHQVHLGAARPQVLRAGAAA